MDNTQSIFQYFHLYNSNVHYKILPMAGFESKASGIESNRSAHWATTTCQFVTYVSYFYLITFSWNANFISTNNLQMHSAELGFNWRSDLHGLGIEHSALFKETYRTIFFDFVDAGGSTFHSSVPH